MIELTILVKCDSCGCRLVDKIDYQTVNREAGYFDLLIDLCGFLGSHRWFNWGIRQVCPPCKEGIDK